MILRSIHLRKIFDTIHNMMWNQHYLYIVIINHIEKVQRSFFKKTCIMHCIYIYIVYTYIVYYIDVNPRGTFIEVNIL